MNKLSQVKCVNLLHRKYGRLTAIGIAGCKNGKANWLWRCDCGAYKIIRGVSVTSGDSRSCGCLQRELTIERQLRHGEAVGDGTPTYRSWFSMKQRCYNPANIGYHNYGGRGIAVCERWLHSFENFYADMGQRPSLDYSIERMNNNKGYSPDNCKWATRTEQQRNRRYNRLLTLHGTTMCLAEWTELLGLSEGLLFNRLRGGWSDERALTTPVRSQRS